VPPDQPAQLTALADDDTDVERNGTNGMHVEPLDEGVDDVIDEVVDDGPLGLIAPPAVTEEPVVGRRERREREAKVKPERAPKRVRLTRKQRKAQYRLRARKVKRVVRRFDAWSVLKVSLVFYLCLYVVAMVAGILLWNVSARVGVIDNIEGFVIKMGAFKTFEFEPKLILEGTALIGAALVVVATGLTVLAAILFNLISDLVGGIRMTVIEEDGARPIGRPPRPPKAKKPKAAKPNKSKSEPAPVVVAEDLPTADV
jgi:hypothetical protein